MSGHCPPATYSCTECSQTFKRLDHLHRHVVSHSDIRAFECSFCKLRFGRRDALLRHWRTCHHRSLVDDAPAELQRQRRGRKRLSCDPCVKAKRKCSRKYPCDACDRLSIECNLPRCESDAAIPKDDSPEQCSPQSGTELTITTFDEVQAALTSMASALSDQSICPDLLASIDNFDVALLDAYSRFRQPAPQPSLPSGLPAMKLSFLSHFTATSGFASSFDCGNSLQRAQIMKKLTPRPIQLPPSPTKSPEMTGCHIEDGRYEATATCIDKHNTSRPGVTSCCWSCHPLYLKSEEIVQGIRKTVEATNMESWTPTMEQECRQFFSPPQIERLVVAFFALWYPNVPIFHRPSFITAHKPAPVVAALALVGATLTSNESEYLGAKRWIDIVEEYVFSDPCLCTDPLPSCTKPTFELMLTLSPRLDAIRAAYCVVLFMQWEGDGVQSSRARSMRYPKVIASTRSILAVDTIQHDPLPTYLEEGQPFMNWKRFTLTEEYIRALLYVFLLDCAFKMFNNCSPRMLSSELNIGLTCPEICFQVANVEEWRRHMRVWAASETGRAQPLVRDVLHFVVKPDLSLSEWTVLCEMGPLNFFALANAFQNMIFHCHDPQAARKKAQIYPALAKMEITDKVAVLQGLRNWKRAWMCRRTVLGDYDIYQVGAGNSWQRVGFFRHGFEFWRLALIVYRNLEATGWLKWDTSFVDKSDMKDVHELITKFQNVNIGEYEL